VVEGFCDKTGAGPQCTYDNAIGVDPNNANIVYALGLFNYGTGSGGIYRSIDGGSHWVDIGYGLHPDFHAIAIRKDDPSHIVIGNDGGWGQDGGATYYVRSSERLETNGNDVANTAVATLALVHAGNTPVKGEYRSSVRHGVDFILRDRCTRRDWRSRTSRCRPESLDTTTRSYR
jgi:photosystem II stability/assembly factor-like uncharacterized protein